MKWAVLILLPLILAGCYSQRKAKSQFSKAATAYPELPADYCARTYPPKEKVVKGADSLIFDTIYTPGETITETYYNQDTVYYHTKEILPGQVISRTQLRVDTIYTENRAALDLCSIERGKAISLLQDKTKEAAKWKRRAVTRFWIITGMGLGFLFFLLAKQLKRAKPI